MRIKSRIFPILSVITSALLSTAACKKDNTVQGPAVAPLSFVFQNRVNQEPVELGVGSYTNANGNAFSFDMLKYYISNIVLVTDDGKEVALNNHSLIDAANLGSEQLQFDSIPKGHYTSMHFQLGIDSLHNHNLDQAGDLDPVNGMFWSWNTGYIFLKHEGTYRNANNEWDQLLFHYGTDGALTAVELALPDVNLDDNGKRYTSTSISIKLVQQSEYYGLRHRPHSAKRFLYRSRLACQTNGKRSRRIQRRPG
ncbi:MAG: hypothetical protein IPL65_19005 [Lewinellaceae bacterium]|nr:hypothetical protein [Lewinellaceae bacterium]